uniref:Phospholipid/glycerol acyltransferase domain-containing protein n=1 Tax=Tetradesmus obliquus TaxID=3088 RepID=A0A383VUK4_TETOB|eukprot:jgi/Sobl393_1/9994/SZX68462.1
MQLRSPNHEACLTSITNGTGRFNCRHVHVSKQRSHLRHREGPRLAAAQVSGSASSLDPPSVTSTMESSLDEATKASAADVLRGLNIKEVQPAALFDAAHVEEWSPQLVAYFPLGCALAAARFAAWIAGIALDAPWFRQMPVINAYMALLGVKVTWRNTHNIPQQRHVLVSNHVSVGDLLMLFQQPQRYVHLITSALPRQVYGTQNLPAILQPANKETYLAIAAQQQQQQQQQQELQQQQLQQQQQQQVPLLQPQHHQQLRVDPMAAGSFGTTSSSSHHSSSSHTDLPEHHQQQQQQQQQQHSVAWSSADSAASVHVFPEGGMTNGSGMMRFSRGFMLFADQLPVVPVALRLKTAFPEVKCHTLDSPFLANLFWFSFQPWTEIEAVALPPMRLEPGESKAAFVQRVQLVIAQELQVWVAELNIQQKRAMVQQQQRKVKQQQKRR